MSKSVSISVALCCGFALGTTARAATLPTPCLLGSCGPKGPATWVTSGAATASAVGNQLTINQSTSQAILNWSNFNISPDGKVTFKQPSGTSIALNRIFQGGPSSIFGSIQANGQIYLINPNGLLFGPAASVNAGGILASTLNISDATFLAGLVSPTVVQSQQAALASDGRTGVIDNNGNPVLGADGKPIPIVLSVEDGAQLSTTGSGGRILLASQAVTNAGKLSAPGGQVILAAGSKVYLAASSDPALRGLLVEVDQGGTAWNALTGQIASTDGNVTLVGLMVNQDGRISASTSVAANGSVELLAQDTIQFNGTNAPSASHSGTATLGPASSIEILPDLNDPATAVADQTQLRSSVTINGEQVYFQGGSQIIAPSGQLTVTATGNPTDNFAPDPAARIRIDSGAVIDLAGSIATLPMSANLLDVQLNATELADDPLQRTGFLHGLHVIIDTRVGTPVANVSADIKAIAQNVAQRTEVGGTANFESAGDLVAATGASINVSGGYTQFLGGTIATTQLIEANGRTVDIGNAQPSQVYTGITNAGYTVLSNTWGVIQTIPNTYLGHYEPGYLQGAAAGSLDFAAPSMVLNATLRGTSVAGPYQRTPSTQPAGGQLVLGLTSPLLSQTTGLADDFRLPSVTFVATAPQIVVNDNTSLLPGLPLLLPTAYLANGFTSTTVYSNGSIAVPAGVPLSMLPGSSLALYANDIDIDSRISAPGGALLFDSIVTDGLGGATLPTPGVHIGDAVTLDVRGNWTNDELIALTQQPASAVNLNGGSITAEVSVPTGGQLSVGSDVQFELSGGAWLQRNHSLQYGNGGSLSLSFDVPGGQFLIGSRVGLDAFGAGTARGGSLTLEADQITIAPLAASQGWETGINQPALPLTIGADLFADYGLSSVKLTANGAALPGFANTFSVVPGTQIDAVSRSWILNPGYQMQPNADSVASFSQSMLLPEAERTPMSVTLAAIPTTYGGTLQASGLAFPEGTTLLGDPGASFALSATGSIDIGGSIVAPGGAISVDIAVPSLNQDPGFVPGLAITLAPSAVLNVAGTTVLQPGNPDLLTGSVLSGGSVALVALRGSVDVLSGAVIDVAGAQGLLDVAAPGGLGKVRTDIASTGGSVLLQSPEAINLLGTLSAAAGHGSGAPVNSGSLTVDLDPSTGGAGEPAGLRTIELTSGGAPAQVSSPTATQAVLGEQLLSASGIDKLVLQSSRGVIAIDPLTDLRLGRELDLFAPSIEVSGAIGSASLTAPYVQISNIAANHALPNPGDGTLAIDGGFIDLVGSTVFSGIAQLNITSSTDVRLTSANLAGTIAGSLATYGDLNLSAERVYPASATSFDVSTTGAQSTLSLAKSGPSPGDPLSVGGAVTFSAPIIVDGGTVLAPFGTITMAAGKSLTLSAGSLTSVSGSNNLFLYGEVIDGDWVYEGTGVAQSITGAPARLVTLQAPTVSIAHGATVDVSGGGDLYTYEWTPGTGGTQDALAASASPGLYAILPALSGPLAPFDPGLSGSSVPTVGQSVYLSGVPGLAAGVYPLLPARYGLLPGAYLVSAVPSSTGLALDTVTSQPNGATVVAGYYEAPGTKLTSGQSVGFTVLPGSYAYQLADYTSYTGTKLLIAQSAAATATTPTAVTTLPASAGTLVLDASESLNAAGSVLTSATSGGVGALIEVSAPALTITGTGVPAASGVSISSEVLQGWNPARLVLGGVLSADNQTLAVSANTVSVGGGAALDLDDITVVAASNISVQSGATLASSAGAGSALSLTPTALALAGAPQAALLEISGLSYEVPARAPTTAGVQGSITLAAGSSVRSNGSAVIDAPGGGSLAGSLSGSGTRWSLGAGEIEFAATPGNAAAFTITPALQTAFDRGTALRIAADTIAFDAPVSLSPASSGLQSLTIEASDIRNLAGAGESSFYARSIFLDNPFAAAPDPQAVTAGTLQLSGKDISIGAGGVTVDGFAAVNLLASADITLSGVGGLNVGGNLTLAGSRLLATSDASGTLQSAGTLNVLASRASTSSTGTAPVGGAITLAANTVNVAGTVLLPSGNISITATSNISLENGAMLDVAGESVTAAGRTLGSPGGALDLTAGGTISAASTATLSVAAAGSNDAGSIQITAGGPAQLDALLAGQAGKGGAGASFQLTAGSVDSFEALNGRLESGGFTRQRSFEVASGDLALPAGNPLTAQSVRLVADTGSVSIGGTITAASNAMPSSIDLYGADGVTLLSTARLLADATGSATQGGNLTFGTTAGMIDLQPGAIISARGSAQAGTLVLRAPASANDVAISEIAADTRGLSTIVVEPVETFAISTSPTGADLANIYNQVTAYTTAAAPQIMGRLQAPSGTSLVVQPGIELDAAGDVNFGALDLTSWRFAGQPGVLTLRAPGNVLISGTVSDGFTLVQGDINPVLTPLAGTSSTIQVVAGAKIGSPDPLATVSGAVADLTLGAGSIVSTGTGAIDLAAARDIVFQTGASIYTGGLAATDPITRDPIGTANFLQSGGAVALTAGRDVVGSFVVSSPGDWQVRGLAAQNTSGGGSFWGPDPTNFAWNIGTLGGGAIEIEAGRDVLNLSAAAADSGMVNNGVLTTYGGGPLTVSAGRDIDTGYFYIAEGGGLIQAGSALGSDKLNPSGSTPLGTMLMMGSSQVDVTARSEVLLESAMNPTIIGQPLALEQVGFFTFGDASALNVQSSGGSVNIAANNGDILDFIGSGAFSITNGLAPNIFPSSLQVRAFGGDIGLNKATIYLYPSADGQLDLFTVGNIVGGVVLQSDAASGSIDTPLTPAPGSAVSVGLFLSAQGAIHQNDPTPAEVTAGLDLQGTSLYVAKPVDVSVGRDMVDSSVVAQNLRGGDVTEITVGRDLRYDNLGTGGAITVGGPGVLDVAAGGQIDLGLSSGISSVGRLDDPQIQASSGADVTVVAGLGSQGMDINGFLSKIVSPSSTYAAELAALVTPAGGSATPTFARAETLFDALSPAVQRQFVDTVFFNELVQAGRLANSVPTSDFARGYAAIDALFPGSRNASATPDPYAGDLTMAFSRIYTLQGGNIAVLVPGGDVDVGLAVPPVGIDVNRPPSQLGIVAQGAGDVDIFAASNVLVNSSRVFTLGGGNIAIWSTTGNIDAGRGAKSSVSAPPPAVLVDALGNITLDFSGAVAGSGIRTIITQAGENPGDVDLIAPVGFVNAGDAGIGSAGNLNIAARFVIGTQNISVGGVATGVPPEVSGIGASLSAASSAGSSTANASAATADAARESSEQATAATSQTALSWLEVFVEGLGEEDCDPKDAECLKRQKRPIAQ